MIDFASFYQFLATDRLSRWLTVLPAQLHAWQHDQQHGDLPRWQRVLAKLESYQVAGSFAATQFYTDIVGAPGDENIDRALEELDFQTKSLRLLGTYPMARVRGG